MQISKHSSEPTSNKSPPKENIEVCQHKKLVFSGDEQTNCYFCGLFISDDASCKTYRSNKMKFNCFMDVNQYATSMAKKTCKKLKISSDSLYLKHRAALIELNHRLSEKLSFSLHSFYLSILYLDCVMSKTMIPLSSFEVYAITCLFVAAKAVELDERVPYISRMVKYFGKNISSNEIKDTERKILEALDWELQTSTMLDILEYYLSQGILFSNDEICLKKEEVNQLKVLMEKDYNSDSKKIEKDIRLIEKGIKYISTTDKEEFQKIENFNENQINFILKNIECQAYNYLEILLRDPNFIDKDIKLLVAALIAYMRKSSKIKSAWKKELVTISNGIAEAEFMELSIKIDEKFDSLFCKKKDEKPKSFPKLQLNPHKLVKDSYFSKISSEINKATHLLLK